MKLFIKKNIIIENYGINQGTPIDDINEIEKAIPDSVNQEVQIPDDVLNSFKIKPSLNQDLWDHTSLKPSVKTKLMKIAKDFFADLKLPEDVSLKDVLFTGSLANYNWSKYSDIDLHIVLDFSKIEGSDQMKEDFFYLQKSQWNDNHNIKLFDFPVEIYAQDISHKLVAAAVYSVKNDKWIVKAQNEPFKINKKLIKDKATRFISRLKDVKKAYENQEYQKVIDNVTTLKNKIKNYRIAGLEKGGEYSLENLVFKTLRRTPFMDVLDSYKAKAYDKNLSLNENLNIVEEGELVDNTKFKFSRDDNSEFALEAIYNGEVIGKAYLDTIYDPDQYFEGDLSEKEISELFGDRIFTIEWVEVPDDYYKGAGVGRALMNKSIEKAKQLGYNQIYLNASPIGQSGLAINELVNWYKSFGFKPFLDQGHNVQMLLNLGQVNETKSKIMEGLSVIIENNARYATKKDYLNTLYKVTKFRKFYGNDEYFNNPQTGQALLTTIANIHGMVNVNTNTATAGNIRKNQPNLMKENPYYIQFQINAGRGMEHPNTYSPNIEPAKTKSPAEDAEIKAYVIYGDEILNFVKKNMKDQEGYKDSKAADISAKAMEANPILQRKKIKKDLEMELGRPITDIQLAKYMNTGEKPQKPNIAIDTDKNADFLQRQADAIARREKTLQRRTK